MKFILSLVPALLIGSPVLAADSVSVAKQIKSLEITQIAKTAQVVKTTKTDKNTVVMVGLPITLTTGNACTEFVGQETDFVRGKLGRTYERITPRGTFDPTMDACIEIAPAPVETILTTTFTLPLDLPAGTTYYKDILVGNRWMRVTYKPEAQEGAAESL